jgi:hypothetical protein
VMEICLAESGTYVSGSVLLGRWATAKATGTSTSWEAFVGFTFLLPHPLWKAHA